MISGITFGFFRVWELDGFVPDILLLLCVSLALSFKNLDYFFVGMVGGILMEVLYGLPIGSFSVPYILAGTISMWIFEKWLFTSGIKWQYFLAIIFISTGFAYLWMWLYTNILHAIHWSDVALSGSQLLQSGLMTLLANLLFAYPVFILVEFSAHTFTRLKKNQIKI